MIAAFPAPGDRSIIRLAYDAGSRSAGGEYMKIKLLGSSVDHAAGPQFSASYLIEEHIAIDAGSIGFMSCLEKQRKIEHVFLTHSHVDHIVSLPIFLDNVYQPGADCPLVYGSDAVRESLLRDVFNERVWPDLIRLSREESPFLRFVSLQPEEPVTIDSITVTPVTLNHVLPTFGFVVEDAQSAVAFVSDTSSTDAIWQIAAGKPHLKAVYLEAAFPNRMRWLADKAGHLTPELFAKEYEKLGRDLPVVAVHIKPAFQDEVIPELELLGLPELIIGGSNKEFEW